MRILSFTFVFIFSFAFITACAPLKEKTVTPQKLNNIIKPSTTTVTRKHTEQTMLITKPSTSPGYKSSQMIYVHQNKPYQLYAFTKNRWVAPPSQMLLPLLVQSVMNTGVFHAVVASPFSGVSDRRLDTQILVFQQELSEDINQFDIIMQATLIDNRSNKIIATRRFRSKVKAVENTPYAGTIAANLAVKNVLERIALFVAQEAKS